MIRLLPAGLLLLCLPACKREARTVSSIETRAPAAAADHLPPMAGNWDRLAGTYAGDFDGSDIRLVLRHLTGRNAVGYNLHRGLRRNISGTMAMADSGYTFELHEPGDHPYDGTFRFTIASASRILRGEWIPQRAGNGLRSRLITLHYVPSEADRDVTDGVTMGDSLGDITFYPDGQAVYRYYPAGNVAARQLQTVSGNWKLRGSSIRIDWQKNAPFPAQRSSFYIMKNNWDDDGTEKARTPVELQGDSSFFGHYYDFTLDGDGRSLYSSEI